MNYKRQAAAEALRRVDSGMKLGLGTGSTANEFIALLAERVTLEPLDLTLIATSNATRQFAETLGLVVSEFESLASLDLTVDGADEIDGNLNLIKGGGGALFREKIAAMSSGRVCIIAESTKRVDRLGKFPLPVEIAAFGAAATLAMVEAAAEDAGSAGRINLRRHADGSFFRTDNGNLIADCSFGAIPDVETLADVLDIVPGVIEHGLFIGIVDEAIVAGPGGVETLYPPESGTR